jgi:hypothetical protein
MSFAFCWTNLLEPQCRRRLVSMHVVYEETRVVALR